MVTPLVITANGGENMTIKYPDIHVKLTGQDGNAFNIMGLVQEALREADVTPSEVADFLTEAKSSDYDHLLQTCMEWVNVT